MTERSVHEAAVEVMAGALRTYFAEEGRPHALTRSEAKGASAAALAALVASADVREGLVAAAHKASVGDWPLASPEGEATRWWVDAILAALAGPEAAG